MNAIDSLNRSVLPQWGTISGQGTHIGVTHSSTADTFWTDYYIAIK